MALSNRLDIDMNVVKDLINSEVGQRTLALAGDRVRNRARQNARGISSRLADSIWTDVPKVDSEGPYVDVGYDKRQPGWVLWFHEVGTRDFPARPHLRPALTQVRD